ncbi:MAG: ribosomal RNA small subunit methyltransferase A [Anaerolineae bacterium]|nr:MAG: ribosomal RNA small subunit methyltransferase A [Anaerolineae bacterium]
MTPDSPSPPLNIAALLRAHGLRPDKRLGQNFLHDESALRKIVGAAELQPTDTVLEIGPGLGSLTRHLARAARRVIAVELDARLLPALRQVLAACENVEIIQGDILTLSPGELISSPKTGSLKVVANIPYYITSAILRHLLSASPRPERLILTVQKEVATRICAQPGNLSLLALSVQVFGHPEIVAHIPAGAFYPRPKVDSAVLRVRLYPQPVIPADELDAFFRLTRAGFGQKRKTLLNALAAGLGQPKTVLAPLLTAAGIDPQRRAQTLTLEEWRALTKIARQQVVL